MKHVSRRLTPAVILICILVFLAGAPLFRSAGDAAGAEEPESPDAQTATTSENAAGSVAEAKARARLLHETLHGALQVMHRDFFDDEEPRKIPSKSLEDVFTELARSHNVKLHWLAINAEALSIDHKPRNEFEKQAVKALSSGEKEYESVTENSYRYVGSIKLASQCLKCHLPNRTSTKDRAAGLVITMPLNISESH